MNHVIDNLAAASHADVSSSLLALAGHHSQVTDTVSIFVALLAGAAVVGVLTKFIRLPYTIALVLAGLGVAILHAAPEEAVITHDLVFVLFLPPLLFQAGLHLDLEHLERKAGVVALLAIPGVIIATVGVALALRPFIPEGVAETTNVWLAALLFGAMLAPTDPISVLATFKTAGAPEALKTLVEGESLFNDGTGVVLFMILFAGLFPVAMSGNGGHEAADANGEPAMVAMADKEPGHAPEAEAPAAESHSSSEDAAHAAAFVDGKIEGEREPSISVARGILTFIKVAGLGVVVGLGLGLIALGLLKRLEDHVLENAITVVLVWGSYMLTEQVGGSGVIAVVVGGLIMGNYGHRLAMSQRTRDTINTFWESIDFIINSIVFLLIGFELQDVGVGALLDPQVLLAVGAVFIAMMGVRAIIVYTVSMTMGRHWPRSWKHVVFWAGMKGSIPMALVLGLPAGELKAFLVPVAFGIVLLSLLGQGLTMPVLLRKLGVSETDTTDIKPT